MGKVRLTSEYTIEPTKVPDQISEQPSAQTQKKSEEYMTGARVPGSSSENAGVEAANVEMSSFDGGDNDEVEEQKDSSTPLQPGDDDLMSGSE